MPSAVISSENKPNRPAWAQSVSNRRRVLGQSFTDALIAQQRYHRFMAIYDASGDSSDLDAAVALFHSLSDATRLAIVQRLASGEARVADLVGELALAQSTVSAHVACLRDCGLVKGRPQGRQVFYSVARPELFSLLSAAETLLTATGNAVALCPNYGTDGAPADPDPSR